MSTPTDGLILCPSCNKGFLRRPERQDNEVFCGTCSAGYPVTDGVLDLLPDASPSRSLAQLAMEFEPIVRIYESRLWRRSPGMTLALGISFEREQEIILGAAGLHPNDTVLDLACGPGIYTRPFARAVPDGTAVGLDLSLPMLRYANTRAREEALTNLILLRGTALQLPFPADRFDLVNCCGALHLFPDVPRVLREIRRVLKPRGRFTVAAVRRRPGRFFEWANTYRRRVLGVDSFSPEELRAKLLRVGFEAATCHHAKGVWLIVSARKPSAKPRDVTGRGATSASASRARAH